MCGHQLTCEESTIAMVAMKEEIWMAINKWIHEGKKTIADLMRRIENWADELGGNNYEEESGRPVNPIMNSVERQGWLASDPGWMAVNIDAATNKGKNALALVARDDQGSIACMVAKFTRGLTANMTELLAMEWAVEIVESLGWPKVLWWSDSKSIMD